MKWVYPTTTKFVGFSSWLLFLASFMLLGVTPAQSELNDTGIKTCSNATQNGLPCPVAGFPGEDAEYGTNSFNYTKIDANGNAMPVTATNHVCVKDNVTGLMWEVKTDDDGLRDKDWTYSWYNSNFPDVGTVNGGTCATGGRCDTEKFVQDVDSTNLCGHNDWRIPNSYELVNIVDYSRSSPSIDTAFFPNTGDEYYYWTTFSDNPYPLLLVSFYIGSVDNGYSDSSGAVRLVRGNQWPVSFVDNNNGTVTDQNTGLMWAKCSEGQSGTDCSVGNAITMTWVAALTTANNSTLAGYSDWRLPNVKELQSIAHYTSVITSSYFPNPNIYTMDNWYWTSSPTANFSVYSWSVNGDSFFGGTVSNYSLRDKDLVVRVVRNAIAAPTAPVVSTDAPSVITANSATLKGTVNPKGAVTTASFDFGTTIAYGTSIVATPSSIAATASATAVSANKTGLTCGTTYHYRVKAVNSKGTSLGADKAFTTTACTANVDFIITNAVLTPAAPTASGTFTATITVKNQGTGAGDGKFLDVWSHQSAAKACGAVGNKRVAVGAIAAGASKVLTVTGLPAGNAGYKMLRAFVDSGCATAESNDNNNQLTALYPVNQATGINFTVTLITLNPASPVRNGTFNSVVQVKNLGTVAGDGKFLDVWSNQPAGQVCSAVGNKRLAVGTLAAGAAKNLTFTGLAAGATAGAKTFRAFVDSGCGTGENNEGNNQLTKAYTVQ